MSLQINGRQQVRVGIGNRRRLQHRRVLRYRQHGFPCLGACIQVTETCNKTVTGVRGQQVQAVRVTGHDPHKMRPVRRVETTGQRLALASGRRQTVSWQGIGTAGGIEKHDLLVTAPLGCREKTVSRLVTERFRVDIVAFCSPHPAFFRQHDRDRVTGNQRRLVQGICRRAGYQCGTPVVTELLTVCADLFFHQRTQTLLR